VAATSLINVAPKCQISEGYCFILCDFICTHTQATLLMATCVKRCQQQSTTTATTATTGRQGTSFARKLGQKQKAMDRNT